MPLQLKTYIHISRPHNLRLDDVLKAHPARCLYWIDTRKGGP
jgi:hypothetical protein